MEGASCVDREFQLLVFGEHSCANARKPIHFFQKIQKSTWGFLACSIYTLQDFASSVDNRKF
jgi:hypothetical protein